MQIDRHILDKILSQIVDNIALNTGSTLSPLTSCYTESSFGNAEIICQ